jgi:hypothetical protein
MATVGAVPLAMHAGSPFRSVYRKSTELVSAVEVTRWFQCRFLVSGLLSPVSSVKAGRNVRSGSSERRLPGGSYVSKGVESRSCLKADAKLCVG